MIKLKVRLDWKEKASIAKSSKTNTDLNSNSNQTWMTDLLNHQTNRCVDTRHAYICTWCGRYVNKLMIWNESHFFCFSVLAFAPLVEKISVRRPNLYEFDIFLRRVISESEIQTKSFILINHKFHVQGVRRWLECIYLNHFYSFRHG